MELLVRIKKDVTSLLYCTELRCTKEEKMQWIPDIAIWKIYRLLENDRNNDNEYGVAHQRSAASEELIYCPTISLYRESTVL